MFAPQLDALAPDYRVIAYDHRARTALGGSAYDLYDLAQDCVNLLDALEIEQCLLVGMSMGGFMALRCALRRPDRLAGVVLIGAGARPYTAEEQQMWDARYTAQEALPTVSRAFAEDEARYCFGTSTYSRSPGLVEHWVDRWTRIPSHVLVHETRSWVFQDDITDRLREIAVPVVALHGLEDTAVPLVHAQATIAAIRGAQMIEIPGAGHTVNLERPAAVNNALRMCARSVLEPG